MTKRKKKASLPSPKASLSSVVLTVLLLLLFYAWERQVPTRIPASDRPIELYANQDADNFQKLFVEAIKSAKKSITLVIYSLQDPSIIKALKKKAQEGIIIHVVCDREGSAHIQNKLGDRFRHLTIRKSRGIMHQKLLVIDEEKTWMGSANMTYSSLRTHGNLVFGIHHPAFAAWITQKAKSFPASGKAPPFPMQTYQFAEQQGQFWFLPDEAAAIEPIKKCLQTAEKTVRVAMYTWTRTDLADEVIAAKNRGVDARVVIDGSQGQGVCKNLVQYLRDHGVPTGLSQGERLLHHKFVYIDQKTLVNGSANWTKAAFTMNDDCFMILSPLTEEQAQKMDRVWQVIENKSDICAFS